MRAKCKLLGNVHAEVTESVLAGVFTQAPAVLSGTIWCMYM